VLTQKKGAPITVKASQCTGCLVCELRCSLRFEKAFNPARAAIQVRRQVGSVSEYEIGFTEKCDNCGLCVRFCSYGALTQEKRKGA
jgi:ferredoxin